jgi:hypothetical protein
MPLSASLVRDFQRWFTSSASEPVVAQAERKWAPAAQKVATMGEDRLTLSKAAKAAPRGPVRQSLKPVSASEKLLASRRVAMNRINGRKREMIVERYLRRRFPEAEGYTVHAEQYLRDKLGRIAHEEASGESRRLDFVVFQGEKPVSTVEVTSKTASKVAQSAKEDKIRRAGGRYLIHPESGKLIRLPAGQTTAVLRLL